MRALLARCPPLQPGPLTAVNQQARGALSFASIILLFASPLLLRWLEYRRDKMLLLLHSHHHDGQSAPFAAHSYAELLPTLEQVGAHTLPCYELIVIYRWNVGEAPSKGTLIVGSTSICSKVRHQVFTRVGSSSSFCR